MAYDCIHLFVIQAGWENACSLLTGSTPEVVFLHLQNLQQVVTNQRDIYESTTTHFTFMYIFLHYFYLCHFHFLFHEYSIL